MTRNGGEVTREQQTGWLDSCVHACNVGVVISQSVYVHAHSLVYLMMRRRRRIGVAFQITNSHIFAILLIFVIIDCSFIAAAADSHNSQLQSTFDQQSLIIDKSNRVDTDDVSRRNRRERIDQEDTDQQMNVIDSHEVSDERQDEHNNSEEDDEGEGIMIISEISSAFISKKTFSCPSTKSDILTGRSTADLSPEDFDRIAAMGDSLSSGYKLLPPTDLDYRGAAFSIGADANVDGLVTIPHILREFSSDLHGASHGMGSVDEMPDYQLNVATTGAKCEQLPAQALELIDRLKSSSSDRWTLIIITIGTEEMCESCDKPNADAIDAALTLLNEHLDQVLVVLVGPIHVSSAHDHASNLLKNRCQCFRDNTDDFIKFVSRQWHDVFHSMQRKFNDNPHRFGVLALGALTITSRNPQYLFMPDSPLLNRRGHTYAAKWLWNRLITGPSYNISAAILSQDAFYCPAMGCPYIRTSTNLRRCKVISLADAAALSSTSLPSNDTAMNVQPRVRQRKTAMNLYLTALVVVVICFCSVTLVGSIFYHRSKLGTKGRFDVIPGS